MIVIKRNKVCIMSLFSPPKLKTGDHLAFNASIFFDVQICCLVANSNKAKVKPDTGNAFSSTDILEEHIVF